MKKQINTIFGLIGDAVKEINPIQSGLRGSFSAALLARADHARDARQWLLARDLYREFLAIAPSRADIWVQLGHAAKESGDLQEAHSAYRRSLEIEPAVADTFLQIGHLLKIMNDTSGAITSFQRALELDGRLFDAKRELQWLGQESASDADVDSASSSDPTTRLLFDLSDVFFYLRHHDTVSGIQRVQLGIADAIRSCTTSSPYQTVFVTESDDGGGYIEIEQIYLVRLIAELKKHRVSHAQLKEIIFSASRSGYLYKAREGDIILFLGAFWVLSNGVERAVRLKSQGVVIGTLIHDIIPITHPEFCDTSLTDTFHMFFSSVLRISDFVLTVSDHSGRTVKQYLDDHGISDVPVITLRSAHKTWEPPPALSLSSSKRIKSVIDEPYVLYVSTIEIRKNHTYLFRIWKMLQAAGDVAVPLLVFVGRPGWRVRDLMDQIESTRGLGGRIRLIHGVSDMELADLYRHAQFTVFPSFEEGWGLPVGESLLFGRPCVASNTSSIPEVGGDFVNYVDPFNTTEGYGAIRRFIVDADYREQRAQQIQRDFRPRLWDDVAQDLIRLISKVTLDGNFRPRPLMLPRLESGKFYELGHAGNQNHFITRGAGKIIHFLFDTNWYPVENFGRWLRSGSGTVVFDAQLAGADSIVIMIVFESPGWVAGNQVEISVADKTIGVIDIVAGSVQRALVTSPVSSNRVEIAFEIIGEIMPGPDLRADLCFGLNAIAYAPANNPIARLMLLESVLTAAAGFSVVHPAMAESGGHPG